MNNTMTVTFQLKKSKANEQGKAPIYVRLTVGGVRTEFSTKRTVDPDRWLAKAGVAKGSTEESKTLNAYLSTVRSKLQEHHRQFLEAGTPISAEGLKNAFLGVAEKGKMILEVFEAHNEKVKALLGKDFSPGTYERYCTALMHVRDFLQWKYQAVDFSVKHIDHEFIGELEFYLKTVRHCSHNSALKYIANFKKIVLICLQSGWMTKNPFVQYKIRLRPVKKEPLTLQELQAIAAKSFPSQRLEQVRDVFLFCCYTGLAYADVKKLTREHIEMSLTGSQLIKIDRTKTEVASHIPLLPGALVLIKKYANHPQCRSTGRLLPVLSNQKLNGYLKEIADVCGIRKNLTTHSARHTFATLAFNSKIPLESVSKMLGHNSTRITTHYAKTLDEKLIEEMQGLEAKLSSLADVNATTKMALEN